MRVLTIDERRDLYKLLNQRKDQELAAIQAVDPNWERRIEERKNKVALGQLRVEKEVTELKDVEEQIRVLRRKRQEIEVRISKKMPLHNRDRSRDRDDEGCPSPRSLCDAVGEICNRIDGTEKAKDPTGKKVLALEAKYLLLQGKLAQCSTREDVAQAKILA